MNLMNNLLGKRISVMISGTSQPLEGVLIEIGQDIIVIKNQDNYLYLPMAHVKLVRDNVEALPEPHDNLPLTLPLSTASSGAPLSLQSIIENAKGSFTEIYVLGVHSLYGYIQNILSDYFVFFSPVFGTILVHLKHLKYLHPYPAEIAPYALKPEALHTNQAAIPPEHTFIQQLKKMEGHFIMLDLADQSHKVGLLKTVQAPMIELVSPNGESLFSMIEHIQTVTTPKN
ncbi:DUF2642 domain-containing protein [Paenibacillus sp. FSL F4-0125]|uniref:DUF2642 domain-containing protein n=1 Tax=Paenibacillus sp. FSL F4-0125 TaxID=2954730 RepID=UPI0030F689B7